MGRSSHLGSQYHLAEQLPWERGANENANGLLRQYVPKGTDLRLVSNELVALALSRINYRPKKCLGFKQPAKVFEEMRLAA